MRRFRGRGDEEALKAAGGACAVVKETWGRRGAQSGGAQARLSGGGVGGAQARRHPQIQTRHIGIQWFTFLGDCPPPLLNRIEAVEGESEKALCCVVKEEISDDNAKLPCFNGRVVSWLVSAEGSQPEPAPHPVSTMPDVPPPIERTGGIGDSRPPSFHANVTGSRENLDNETETESVVLSRREKPRRRESMEHGPRVNGHPKMERHLAGYESSSTLLSSELETTSFCDSDEDDAASRFSSSTEQSTNSRILKRHRRRRKQRPPRLERASSFSSVTDSTMSLNIITVTLNMEKYNFLGISIVGQSNERGDGGIYIGSIMKGGAVAADGRIEPGDMLLQVNDINFENMSNDDAVRVLREIVHKPGVSGCAMKIVNLANLSLNDNDGSSGASDQDTLTPLPHPGTTPWPIMHSFQYPYPPPHPYSTQPPSYHELTTYSYGGGGSAGSQHSEGSRSSGSNRSESERRTGKDKDSKTVDSKSGSGSESEYSTRSSVRRDHTGSERSAANSEHSHRSHHHSVMGSVRSHHSVHPYGPPGVPLQYNPLMVMMVPQPPPPSSAAVPPGAPPVRDLASVPPELTASRQSFHMAMGNPSEFFVDVM
ncbi:hypothetical protein chiPu_0019912 [Chiloscyllium punctatum]|uniref:PDZ domain-containing protein n=1 Tax=Chiloscyllium punctatum TaxID=137246 RepID=A0A401RTI6_CHIPU|nr:hypothetical protein [Chiloscyllium punctatum]